MPSLCQSFFGGEDQGGVAIGDLRAIVGLERQSIDDVAIEAFDLERLVEGDLHLVHLRAGVELRVGILLHRDCGQVAFGDTVGVHVLAHDFGEDVREDEDLALALAGMGEVAEHLADELAVHLAFGVAHLFVADGDTGFAHAELQFLNHAEHGLPARGAGVLHRFDGLAFEARRVGHQAGEQSLLVEGEIAGRADAAHVQRGGLGADLAAGALDGGVENLGHGHAHQLAELRLVKGGDVDRFHGSVLLQF